MSSKSSRNAADRPRKILIVEDDPVSQTVLKGAVEDVGRDAVCVGSGEEAWSLLLADPHFDIAFIDWIMPGMSGPQLCARIRQHLTDRYVYTIMVTSKTGKQDLMRGLESGADDFVSKPVHSGELISRLHAGERVVDCERRLREERERSDRLLRSILPEPIAFRLKSGEKHISDFHRDCSVLFLDIVGFTEWCMRMDARSMITQLASFFAIFDEEIRRHEVEKIKSIGDAYLVAAGIPRPDPRHATKMVALADSIRSRMSELNRSRLHPWSVRMGVASGALIAGVIGVERVVYDVWGHTVNLASRLESMAPRDEVLVSEATWELTRDEFRYEEFGRKTPKGCAPERIWRLVGTEQVQKGELPKG
ncbi:MAG: response regulator, partial [Verrucomicrobiae bacterium]|nr:response regulator [Verrucomicrobiae bacterium]